jgi:hypothetical protein
VVGCQCRRGCAQCLTRLCAPVSLYVMLESQHTRTISARIAPSSLEPDSRCSSFSMDISPLRVGARLPASPSCPTIQSSSLDSESKLSHRACHPGSDFGIPSLRFCVLHLRPGLVFTHVSARLHHTWGWMDGFSTCSRHDLQTPFEPAPSASLVSYLRLLTCPARPSTRHHVIRVRAGWSA